MASLPAEPTEVLQGLDYYIRGYASTKVVTTVEQRDAALQQFLSYMTLPEYSSEFGIQQYVWVSSPIGRLWRTTMSKGIEQVPPAIPANTLWQNFQPYFPPPTTELDLLGYIKGFGIVTCPSSASSAVMIRLPEDTPIEFNPVSQFVESVLDSFYSL